MKHRSRLADPPAVVTALLLGGLAIAVNAAAGIPVLVAVLIGASIGGVVYAVATGLDRLAGRRTPAGRVPAPATRALLDRADRAAAALHRHWKAAGDPDLERLLGTAAARAAAVATGLRERAGAVAAVEDIATGTDLGQLRRERERLVREAAAQPPGRMRAEKEAAERAAAERLASHERLADLRALLLASIESSVLQAEAVAARASVLLSMGVAGGPDGTQADLDQLTAELTAAQEALERTEEITRQLLGQAPG